MSADRESLIAFLRRASFFGLSFADGLLHLFGLADAPLLWRVCDAYDLALGVPDTPANFPRRWGVA